MKEENKKENSVVSEYSQKSSFIFGLLGLFLGFVGAHNFYIRRYKQGIIQFSCFMIFVAIKMLLANLDKITKSEYDFIFTLFVMSFVFPLFFIPLWIILNLFLTKKDGQGLLIKNRKIAVVFGVLVFILFVLNLSRFLIDQSSIAYSYRETIGRALTPLPL